MPGWPCLRLAGQCCHQPPLPPGGPISTVVALPCLLPSDNAESEKQRRKDLVRAAGRAAVEQTLLAPSGGTSQSKALLLS